jgi:alkylation response protein AidB-like acyl-CoA dehydrogenase
VNFDLSPEQDELRALARRILAGGGSAPWPALAAAGLAGLGLPEAGGSFLDAAVVLEEVGRATTVGGTALAVLGLANPALGRFGSAEARAGVAEGDRVVTSALHEPVGDPASPATRPDEDGRLTGTKVCVPAGTVADAFVVSAVDGLHLVDAGAEGVTVESATATTGEAEAILTLDGAPATRLADRAGLTWLLEHATTARCLVMAGVAQRALELTAGYTKERKQFDRAIASFQAVSQRAGDAYIDTEAVRLTAWQAAWRLDAGLPAAAEVATAAFWAADAGQRVVHAAVHLHGGVGVDRSYPLHRCFLWAKQLELALGGATPSLARLGRLLADDPVA